jgi:type II restriction/modification system DNA methylase subunit YeeA
MLLNTIDALENNKLKKFSSENLKSLLCIHTNISNKLDLIIKDLSASTSHASDFESNSIVI